MIKALIFDYGGTLDTGGNHWGQVLWHAYQRCSVPVSEQQFREAYVQVERLLGSQPVIQPDFTFRQTLATKISLQMQFLELSQSYGPTLVDAVYRLTQQHTAHNVEVLTQLKSRYVLMLVSNFYGNLSVVLREFGFDDLEVYRGTLEVPALEKELEDYIKMREYPMGKVMNSLRLALTGSASGLGIAARSLAPNGGRQDHHGFGRTIANHALIPSTFFRVGGAYTRRGLP